MLKHDTDNGEQVKADLGYNGDFSVKVPGLLCFDEKYRAIKMNVVARHETVNIQIKVFSCLTEKFRYGVDKHLMCFRTITVLTLLVIESGGPICSVEYSDNCEVYLP